MTNNGDPYENAVAERINGILKQEFMLDTYHQDLSTMQKILQEAIEIYNRQRPHYSNFVLTPQQMHSQNIMVIRTYKTKNSSKNQLAAV